MVAIAEAEKKDDGWYQCTAVNPVGSAATRARLQVLFPQEKPDECCNDNSNSDSDIQGRF